MTQKEGTIQFGYKYLYSLSDFQQLNSDFFPKFLGKFQNSSKFHSLWKPYCQYLPEQGGSGGAEYHLLLLERFWIFPQARRKMTNIYKLKRKIFHKFSFLWSKGMSFASGSRRFAIVCYQSALTPKFT